MSCTVRWFRETGELLEIGCCTCGRHGYFDTTAIPLPDDLPLEKIARRLRCSSCGTKNSRESNWPIWIRADARQAECPSGPLPRPAGITLERRPERGPGIPYTHEQEAREISRQWAESRK